MRLWRCGRFEEALERFLSVVAFLQQMPTPRDQARMLRKVLLQHGNEHNLAQILINIADAQPDEQSKTAVVLQATDLISKARFFEDERYDMQRPDLEGRLEETTLDGSVRMQFRFAIQQTVRTLWSALPMLSFVESDWLSRQANWQARCQDSGTGHQQAWSSDVPQWCSTQEVASSQG